jgi:hypothetical protein
MSQSVTQAETQVGDSFERLIAMATYSHLCIVCYRKTEEQEVKSVATLKNRWNDTVEYFILYDEETLESIQKDICCLQ